MFTCDTCQETLNNKPLWFCAVCAMKQHRGHAMSECNKATRQQIQDACKGIAGSGSLADMYIGLATSHLNGALEATGHIVQLLNEQKSGFSRLEERVSGADDNLARGDLTAALQAASDLKQKFERASTITSEARKDLESVLQVCRQKLEELFPKEQEQVRMETEDSATEAPKVPQAIFQNRKFAFTSAARVNRAGQPQFNKRELRTLIEQRGGTVIDDFHGLSDDDDAYLIADTHYRTHKYLWALSLSVPCVHHTWITECVEQDTFVDFKEYMLSAGQALGPDGTVHEYAWKPQKGQLMAGKKVWIHSKKEYDPPEVGFVQLWSPIMRAAGAEVVRDDEVPQNALELVQWITGGGVDVIVTDASCEPLIVEAMEARESGVVVGSEWIIEALITGELPDASNARYRHNA